MSYLKYVLLPYLHNLIFIKLAKNKYGNVRNRACVVIMQFIITTCSIYKDNMGINNGNITCEEIVYIRERVFISNY